MKHKAGLLKILLWRVIMLHSLEAGHSLKKHANMGLSCKPKQLASLTKSQVEMSLTKFDEANGKHLGTWPPGFPELTVDQNSTSEADKVQCSLLFLARGLEKILEDQRNNLNPEDVSLHQTLKESISRVDMLRICLSNVLGGNCSPRSPPPEMPKYVFDRKQWSHTLLKAARQYLDWLQNRLVRRSKVNWTLNIKQRATKPRHRTFFEGSGHLL